MSLTASFKNDCKPEGESYLSPSGYFRNEEKAED
jgi:hypothetical protein